IFGGQGTYEGSAGGCLRVLKIPIPAQIETALREQGIRRGARAVPIPAARERNGGESDRSRRTAALVEAAAPCFGFRGGRQVAGVAKYYDIQRASRSSENMGQRDRKSTRLNSSHQISSYAVFCLKKKSYRRLST